MKQFGFQLPCTLCTRHTPLFGVNCVHTARTCLAPIVYTKSDNSFAKSVYTIYASGMTTVTTSVSIRELRSELSDVIGRASYGRERVQINKNGKPAAFLIGPEDFELLEALELIRNYADFQKGSPVAGASD